MTINCLPYIGELSALPQEEFVAALDGIYEHSPWVAATAWKRRSFGSFSELADALQRAVEEAPPQRQLALVRAHPELAGKVAMRGELTAESTREQSGAGLDRCSPDEFERLTRLNQDYGTKFGFPFIIAARGHTPTSIIEEFTRRLAHQPEQELEHELVAPDRNIRACQKWSVGAPVAVRNRRFQQASVRGSVASTEIDAP